MFIYKENDWGSFYYIMDLTGIRYVNEKRRRVTSLKYGNSE